MMRVATIKHNNQKRRLGIYYKKNSLYFKENGNYIQIDESKDWTNIDNYVDILKNLYGSYFWDLKIIEIQY